MSYQVGGYIYNAYAFNYGNIGVYDSSANISGGVNNWTTYTHFVGPEVGQQNTMNHMEDHLYQVEHQVSSPQFSLVSGSTTGYGYWVAVILLTIVLLLV